MKRKRRREGEKEREINAVLPVNLSRGLSLPLLVPSFYRCCVAGIAFKRRRSKYS